MLPIQPKKHATGLNRDLTSGQNPEFQFVTSIQKQSSINTSIHGFNNHLESAAEEIS